MLTIIKIIVFALAFGAIGFSIVLLVFDGKTPNFKKGNIKKNNNNDSKGSQNKKADNKKSSVNFLPVDDALDFDDIEIFNSDNPMGVIVRDNKTNFVGAIEVSGINYNLLSVEERELLEDSFCKLLNGIDFPIQLFIQSRKLNINSYDKKYDTRLKELKSNIDSLNSRYKFLNDNNINDENNTQISKIASKLSKLTNQYNYGIEIKNYIMDRCKEKNVLERKYYIVLSHTHNSSMFEEALSYDEILKNAFFDIANKSNSIISGLQRAKLKGKCLSGYELAELLYSSYNKYDSDIYKMEDAIKSQYSHLYTTAVPVELKRITRELSQLEKTKDEEIRKLQELETKRKEEDDYYNLDDSENNKGA